MAARAKRGSVSMNALLGPTRLTGRNKFVFIARILNAEKAFHP
jgi:hypothetical protein